MMPTKKHQIYLIKHEKSRTAYVRMLSTSFAKPDAIYLKKPLFDMLRRRIPYCDSTRFKQIAEHIAKHNLYATGKASHAGKSCWHESWKSRLVGTYSSQEELIEKFEASCIRCLKKGWFVLNAKDVPSDFFLEHFNVNEYNKALAEQETVAEAA